MELTKLYNDLQPLYFKDFEPTLESTDVVSSSRPEALSMILEYYSDDTVNRWSYGTPGKKEYHHRMGHTLEIMLPLNLGLKHIAEFSKSFMNRLLAGQSFVWICEYYEKGQGRHLKYTLLSAKKYKTPKESYLTRKSDGYKNAKTGKMCKATDKEAIIAYKKGDKYANKLLNWSKRKRFFEMTKKQFSEFRTNLEIAFTLAVQQFIKGCKVITNNKKKKKYKMVGPANSWMNINFNRNIWQYNVFIDLMNEEIEDLDRMIYSPAKYYQDPEIKSSIDNIYHKYRTPIENSRFRVKSGDKYRKSINPYAPAVIFEPNMKLLVNTFLEEIETFKKTYIYDIYITNKKYMDIVAI